MLEAAKKHDRMIVMLGVALVKGDSDDPMDFASRYPMVKDSYPNAHVIPLPNQLSNASWSHELDRRVREIAPFGEVMLYCGRDGFKSKYSGKFPVTEIAKVADVESGTEIRKTVGTIALASEEFRAGVIYGLENRYPQTIPTVDIAVFTKHRLVPEVLMAERPGVPGLRFPGGFVDFTDGTMEESASRELIEETGYIPQVVPTYVASSWIDDSRYKGRRASRIMTTLYTVRLEKCSKANPIDDELVNFKWVRLDMEPEGIDPAHMGLFQSIKKHYKVK